MDSRRFSLGMAGMPVGMSISGLRRIEESKNNSKNLKIISSSANSSFFQPKEVSSDQDNDKIS